MQASIAASIRARLLTKAKDNGEKFDFALVCHAYEQFLYRLSESNLRGICLGFLYLARVWI